LESRVTGWLKKKKVERNPEIGFKSYVAWGGDF